MGFIIGSICWDAEVGHAQAMVFSDECGRLCDLSEAPWLSCTVGGPKKNKNSKRGAHWRADGNPGKRLRSDVPASPSTIAFDQPEGVADKQQGDVDSVPCRNTFDDPEGDARDEECDVPNPGAFDAVPEDADAELQMESVESVASGGRHLRPVRSRLFFEGQPLSSSVWQEFTPKHIDHKKCYARTWANGHGGQCVRAVELGRTLCTMHHTQHSSEGGLAHGMVTGAIPAKETE